MRLTKARLFTLIFIGVFIATTTAAVCCYAVAGASVDDSSISHYKQSGPGYDIYLPKSSNMNFEELIFVVNYGDEPLILNITGTIYGQDRQYAFSSIEPRSSEWVKVTFLDVGAAYQLYLGRPSQPLMILPLTRSVEEYVPPQGGGWVYVPPPEQGPAVYTQHEWDTMIASFWALIAQISFETVVIVSFMAGAGLGLGIAVKSKVKFVAPTDPISIIILIGGTIDAIARFSPMGLFWLPLLLCYVIGYLIYHIEYFSPILTNCETRRIDIKPYVIYFPDNGTTPAIQPQTWRGLYKRAVGHHHTLSADGSLNGDWKVSLKKPLWPLLSTNAVFVERQETEIKPVKSRLGPLKVSSTKLILASGSQLNKIDLLVSINKFLEFKDRWKEDRVRLTELELQSQTQAIDTAADLLTAGINVSPALVVSRMLKRNKEAVSIDKIENEFTHLEDRITELPEDEQQIEEDTEDEE